MAGIKTQGTAVAVQSALAATKTISGATAANPVVVTATAHGYANGAIVKIANVVGMVQLNNRAFVVANQATNTFELKGVDGTNYSAYLSGGDSYVATMIPVGTVDGIPSAFTGTAPTIRTTHLLSLSEEKIMGLQDFGDCSLSIILDTSNAGQLAMQTAKEIQSALVFTFTASDTKVAGFCAFVTSFSMTAAANDIWRATSALLLQNAPSKFA